MNNSKEADADKLIKAAIWNLLCITYGAWVK